MGILRWIFGLNQEEQLVSVLLPKEMVAAMDTLIHMDGKSYVNRADVISIAVDEHLQRNIWLAKSKTDYVTQIKHPPSFRPPTAGTGIKQNKTTHS